MLPHRIILIRHGMSEGNINPDIYATKPDHLLELTEEGKRQALQAGLEIRDFLKEETIHFYVSPHLRSRQTYDQLALSLNGKMYEDPRIREQEWGHFRSKAETKVIEEERNRYGTFYYRFPNGESGADVYDRTSAFLETIHRDFSKPDYPKNVIVVTHGLTIRVFIMRWFHLSVAEYETWKNPKNCQYYVMERGFGVNGFRYTQPTLEKY